MSYEDATAFETKYRTEMNTDCMNGYLQDLYMDIDENIDRDAIKKHFNKMKKWFEKRNSLIHGLVNKTADDDFEREIKMIAIDSAEAHTGERGANVRRHRIPRRGGRAYLPVLHSHSNSHQFSYSASKSASSSQVSYS